MQISSSGHIVTSELFKALISPTPLSREDLYQLRNFIAESPNEKVICTDPWTTEEVKTLVDLAIKNEALKMFKKATPLLSWKEIAAFLPQRTEIACVCKWKRLKQDYLEQIHDVHKMINNIYQSSQRQRLETIPKVFSNVEDTTTAQLKYSQMLHFYEAALLKLNTVQLPGIEIYINEGIVFNNFLKLNMLQKNFTLIEDGKKKIAVYNAFIEHYDFCKNEFEDPQKFLDVYHQLLSGQIDIKNFESQILHQESEFHKFNLTNLLQDNILRLCFYTCYFTPLYNEELNRINETILNELSLLPNIAQENPLLENIGLIRYASSEIRAKIQTNQLLENFFQLAYTKNLPLAKIESLVLAKLRNAMTFQDFSYAAEQILQAHQCHETMRIENLLN